MAVFNVALVIPDSLFLVRRPIIAPSGAGNPQEGPGRRPKRQGRQVPVEFQRLTSY